MFTTRAFLFVKYKIINILYEFFNKITIIFLRVKSLFSTNTKPIVFIVTTYKTYIQIVIILIIILYE